MKSSKRGKCQADRFFLRGLSLPSVVAHSRPLDTTRPLHPQVYASRELREWWEMPFLFDGPELLIAEWLGVVTTGFYFFFPVLLYTKLR